MYPSPQPIISKGTAPDKKSLQNMCHCEQSHETRFPRLKVYCLQWSHEASTVHTIFYAASFNLCAPIAISVHILSLWLWLADASLLKTAPQKVVPTGTGVTHPPLTVRVLLLLLQNQTHIPDLTLKQTCHLTFFSSVYYLRFIYSSVFETWEIDSHLTQSLPQGSSPCLASVLVSQVQTPLLC